MDVARINESVKRHGLIHTVEDLVTKKVNQYMVLRVLKGIQIENVDPKFLDCDEPYQGSFLDYPTLHRFAERPEHELSPEFLERAAAKGDECYGFVAGDALAAYGWYSHRPTSIDIPGLVLHFDPAYVYMYKGFTHPAHRGHRLHAVGMTRALKAYLDQGHRGVVSYVEHNNYDSLRSCYRMGYADVGNIYVGGLPRHYFFFSDPGCERLGLRLAQGE